MEELTRQISAFPYLGLLLGSLVLYFSLRIVNQALLRFIKRSKLINTINRNYSIFELFIWLLYVLWMLPSFFKLNMSSGIVLSIILVISILFISWFAGRDFIAGFIIKSNSGFKLNARIKTDKIEGEIVDFFPRNVKLINDKGEKMLIPYSNLLGENLFIKTNDKSRISKHIQLTIGLITDYYALNEKLRFMIMMHPKALVNNAPTINIISQSKTESIIDITIFARDHKGLAEIETFLKKELQSIVM